MKSSSQSPRDGGAKAAGGHPDASRGAGEAPTGRPSGIGSPTPSVSREPQVDDRNRNDVWDDDVPTVMIEEEDEEVLEDDEDFLDEDIEDDDEGDDDVPIADEQRQHPGS